MTMKLVQASFEDWNQTIASLPQAHLLQTREWGQIKSEYGWQAFPYIWKTETGKVAAAAMILQRELSLGGLEIGRILYIPKGPLLDWGDHELRRHVLHDLAGIAQKKGAIFIKIDPDVVLGLGEPGEETDHGNPIGEQVLTDMKESGWRLSAEQIQFRNTILIDLKPDSDLLLAGMKQKTRYNIRLAGRKGVTVRIGEEADLPDLYRLYAETSVRDGFVIRSEDYYQTVWLTFLRSGMLAPLIAEVEGQMVGALMIFNFNKRAWYIYGMSGHEHREKMPNYLLQWQAIQHAKAQGCLVYDLWGAPDEFTDEDPLWGVYRFKRGLGGAVVRHIGAWDLPLRPWIYRLYSQILPRALELMRRRGTARTQQSIT